MKSIIRDYAKIRYALLFPIALLSTKALSQEKFVMTPTVIKTVENYSGNQLKVYKVKTVEAERKSLVTIKTPTKWYLSKQKEVAKYKPAFDTYNQAIAFNAEKKDAISTIIKNINAFIESNEKYAIKEKLLIDAQSLADKYSISIIVPVDPNNVSYYAPKKTLYIYKQGEKTSKSDLKEIINELNSTKIVDPIKSYDYQQYVVESEKLANMSNETEDKIVLSDSVQKVKIYVVGQQIDYKSLSGNFIEFEDGYEQSNKNVEYQIQENELFTKKHDLYDSSNHLVNNHIIKNTATGEMYYTNMSFAGISKQMTDANNYAKMGSAPEYISWKARYINTLQSAKINVDACKAIIRKYTYTNAFGEKMYDSSKFSSQDKLTFNKNLDVLNDKNKKIYDLEHEKEKEFYSFYADKASPEEVSVSYKLSQFYNDTSRAY